MVGLLMEVRGWCRVGAVFVLGLLSWIGRCWSGEGSVGAEGWCRSWRQVLEAMFSTSVGGSFWMRWLLKQVMAAIGMVAVPLGLLESGAVIGDGGWCRKWASVGFRGSGVEAG